MNRMRLVGIVCLLLSSRAVADGSKPDPRAILERANAAAKALKAISYDAKIFAEGPLARNVPTFSGNIIAERGVIASKPKARISGESIAPGGTTPTQFRYATDSKQAYRIDDQKKQFISGAATTLESTELTALLPPKYFVDAPFRGEMNMQMVSYEGVEKIDGVDCDVIKISFDANSDRAMKYWLGAKDSLLRKIENVMIIRAPGNPDPERGRIVFETSHFTAEPKIDDSTFALVAPEGYSSEALATPEFGADGLLAAGRPAPNWELKDAEGKTVSLKDLRGKVVLMDFWASWCSPCKMVMPIMQKLHEKFKGKDVVICGINCREKGEDGVRTALTYAKSQNFTYKQLVRGDDIAKAYYVRGIPCMYLIGPDGNIIYATAGFQPGHEDMFTRFIEETLKSMPAAEGTKVSAK